MSLPTPLAPGWYRDTADRQLMRHWSGDGWDGRARRVPPWMTATKPFVAVPPTLDNTPGSPGPGGPQLDGPARSATLPANVTSGGRSRLAPSPKPAPPVAGPLPAAGAARTRPPAGTPDRAGLHPLDWHRRAPLVVTTALVLVAMLVVATTVGLAKRPVTAGQLSADTPYISAANGLCATAVGGVKAARPAGAAAPSPPTVAKANGALHRLAARLLTLPSGQGFRHQLGGWLTGWERFGRQRAALAAYVAAHPRPDGIQLRREHRLAAAETATSRRADSFAYANSLGDCVIGDSLPKGLTVVP